jgi:hypothetical protein
LKDSIIQNNSDIGVYIGTSTTEPHHHHLIYNNIFNNTNNFYFYEASPSPNYWNTTITQGTNIVGGPYIGGNYWGKPDGTGYSDTCNDTNADGFCDDPYVLAENNTDYLPIAKTVGQYPTYINISDCSVLDQPGYYVLTNDIPYPAYYLNQIWCIQIASDNVTLDCNYHSMTGNASGSAIWFMDRNNVTVKNCLASNYDETIWAKGNNSRFENIEVWNGYRGITLMESINMTLINFTAHDLSGEGVNANTNSSEFVGIKSYSNYMGIRLDGLNNTLTDSEFWNITDKAILVDKIGNTIKNVVIRDSQKNGIWVDWESNENTIDNVTIYNLPNDFPIYITSDNNIVKNSLIYNSYAGIGIHSEGDYDTLENIEVFNTSDYGISIDGSNHVLRNLTVHSTKGIWVWGSNHLLEDIETFDTTPENTGLEIHSDNTVLRNIYNHDEPRSTISGNNNTLEYSRCENVTWGCWHLFGNNTTVRHNDFQSGISFFGAYGSEVYNNTIGALGGLEARDWNGITPTLIDIYNNTFNFKNIKSAR